MRNKPPLRLNGYGGVIDISHRIIAKFSKAHSLAGLNRREQLFDNDPRRRVLYLPLSACFSTLLSASPRCFEPLVAKERYGRPSNSHSPLQSNASDEKTFAFSVFTVLALVAVEYARPRHSNPRHSNVCSVINVRVSWPVLTLIGCGDTTALYPSPSGSR